MLCRFGDFTIPPSRISRREQLAIARFWANPSLAIASQIPVQESANLETAAETYARVGIAVADAVTAVWHAKYTDNHLRRKPFSARQP
jgi:hypothetical protein